MRVAAGKEWQPRWFRQTVDPQVFEGEATAEQCPHWEFTGSYLTQHPPASSPTQGEDPPPPPQRGGGLLNFRKAAIADRKHLPTAQTVRGLPR